MNLYVDLKKLDLVKEQHDVMQKLIEEWGSTHGLLQTNVATNTSGTATDTYMATPEGMDDEKFLALYDKVKAMSSTLEQAGLDVKALLNRVEEFYDILCGVCPNVNADYLAKGEPTETVAVLDTENESNIILETNIVKNQTIDEKAALEDCCSYLSNLKKVNVPYATDKTNILSCIRKQGYIDPLCTAFLQYVVEVQNFNRDTQRKLDAISEDDYTPVTDRTYNIAEMAAEGCDAAILLKIVDEVLDKAGITEEERQNALNNGMTLYQLAFDTSLIAQGDTIRGNNYGMTMWKLVLDGNYSDAFNTMDYQKNMAGKDTLDVWYAIADYQISSVSIDKNNNCDCTVFEAMLSEEIGLGDAEKENLELGAYYVTMKKSLATIIMNPSDKEVYDEVYKDYSKSLALYNTIVLCDAKYKVESGSYFDSNYTNDYSINNVTMEYDGKDAVINLTFRESRKWWWMDAGHSDFDMTISSSDETFSNLLSGTVGHQEELIEQVKEEQEKIAKEALKGGLYLATDIAGYSTGVGSAYTGILKFSFAALEADYSSGVKTGASVVSTTLNNYTKTWENQGNAKVVSNLSSLGSAAVSDVVPIYTYLYDNVFTSNGQDAINDQYDQNNKDNYSIWFGSYASCVCNEAGGQTYDQIQSYVPAPENYNNYVLISSDTGGGIAGLMNWNQNQIDGVMNDTRIQALIGGTTNAPDDITEEDVIKVINGGYDFQQSCGYTKFSKIMDVLCRLNESTYGDVEQSWLQY